MTVPLITKDGIYSVSVVSTTSEHFDIASTIVHEL